MGPSTFPYGHREEVVSLHEQHSSQGLLLASQSAFIRELTAKYVKVQGLEESLLFTEV